MLAACSAAPHLKDYPEREIDRPYTLPKGLASWQTISYLQLQKSSVGSDHTFFIDPLFWNQSLSDDWQLTWMPFPLIIRHQFSKDEQGYWGGMLFLSFYSTISTNYSTSGTSIVSSGTTTRFTLTPAIDIKRRQIINSDFAMDLGFFARFNIHLYDPAPSNFLGQFGFNLSPLFQISNTFEIAPTLNPTFRKFSNFLYDFNAATSFETSNYQFYLPIGFQTQYLLAKQWELRFEYELDKVGHSGDYTAHHFAFTTTHYW